MPIRDCHMWITALCSSQHAGARTCDPAKGLHPDANTSTTAELPAPKKPCSALCSAPQRAPFFHPHPPRCASVCAAFRVRLRQSQEPTPALPCPTPRCTSGQVEGEIKKKKKEGSGGDLVLRWGEFMGTLWDSAFTSAAPLFALQRVEIRPKVAVKTCKGTAWRRGRLGMPETCCGSEGD